jgi:putative tricarboxylic transport membrane protein
MEILSQTLMHMATTDYWVAFSIGLALATAIGIIPGIGATVTMAIAFPIVILTFDEPAIGIVMLAVITGTGNTLDSLPAQLMGITTGGTQVSFLEGHQLARKGLAAYSLGAVYAVSAIGGIVGAFFLLAVMQLIGPLVMMMSYPEIAVMSLFGLSMIAVLSKGAMLKGLSTAALGVILGTVGLQVFTNTSRFVFDIYELRAGIPLVALVVGLMAVPEMLDLAASRKPVAPENAVVTNKEVFRGFREGLRNWKLAVRHSIFGVVLGAIPGTGGSFVTWMSYGLGIAASKDKSEFGKGSLKGLMFAESAENAKEGGQAIPSLALGIPGSTSWALVIAALLSYGIAPGPQLVEHHSDIIWLIVISFALANLIVTMLALVATRQIVRITQIPYPAIIATTLPIMVLGAYFADQNRTVIPLLILASMLGLLMKFYRWPRPPLVLGFILADPIEKNLFSGVNMFGVAGLFTRPFTIIVGAIALFIVWRLLRSKKKAALLARDTEAADELLHDPASASMTPVMDTGRRGDGPDGRPVTEGRENRLQLRWRSEHWVALGFCLIGLYVLYVSLHYTRLGAILLPSLVAATLALASGIYLARLVLLPPKETDILDIAMLSVGMDGAREAAMKMLFATVTYVLLIYLIGLKWAGVPFAIMVPVMFMKGRSRAITVVFSVGFYLLFAISIGDALLNMRWPHGWLY